MKRASIDIGSNSILLLIINDSNNKTTVIENISNVTGLGRDLDKNKRFIEEAMTDSMTVLKDYSEICKKHEMELDKVIVTATEASRVAKNAKDFFRRVKLETGLTISIINPEAEAYYSTVGILLDDSIKEPEITIMDIGGASTELIKVNTLTKEIVHTFSMPIGAVRMNNWFLEGSMEENLSKVLNDFSEDIKAVSNKKLYCVAGTMTSVGNIYLENKEFIEDEVHGLKFSNKDLKSILLTHEKFSVDEFLNKFPFLGKRSRTIKSGLILANKIISDLKVEEIQISTYGLRYGSILENKIPNKFLA